MFDVAVTFFLQILGLALCPYCFQWTTVPNTYWRHRKHLRRQFKEFFTKIKVMRHWNRLLRLVMDAQSLEIFEVRLDEALSR